MSTSAVADTIFVSSLQEFNEAHDGSMPGDTIVWRDGVYPDVFMDIDNDSLYIRAENLGETIFTGLSRVDITSDYITLEGFQFVKGNIGTLDVINTRGSYNVFTQLNIREYRSYKYLRVREESQYCEITYCNFENRTNLDDQNILSILVSDDNPGYHKIQWCSFKNFEGTGNDLGIEPIRIGVSSQADNISRTLVEYCYFTECDGDGELISSKATQNVYRFNTFENNTKAELVLRHGSEIVVYGNFFLNGKGGVRVREGQDHYIYNNYFYNLDDRAIFLQNDDSDPLDNINIAFNTVHNCAEIILGGDGNDQPTNVTFANNIFSEPLDDLFEDQTSNETWIGNIAIGEAGISLPDEGITVVDTQLESNSEGFFGLLETSEAIDAAQTGFAPLPQFDGIDDIDFDISFDIMGQSRPSSVEEKDLGCNEHPHMILIQPIATEENTGPSYNTSSSTSTKNTRAVESELVEISPNPISDLIFVKLNSEFNDELSFVIFDSSGKQIDTSNLNFLAQGKSSFTISTIDFPEGIFTMRVTSRDRKETNEKFQIIRFVKVK